MATHKVRTTITPGEVLTVDDAEHLDLMRMGLILDEKDAKKIEAAEARAEANETKEG